MYSINRRMTYSNSSMPGVNTRLKPNDCEMYMTRSTARLGGPREFASYPKAGTPPYAKTTKVTVQNSTKAVWQSTMWANIPSQGVSMSLFGPFRDAIGCADWCLLRFGLNDIVRDTNEGKNQEGGGKEEKRGVRYDAQVK